MAVDRVFTDKASGKDTQRPELENLLAFIRQGDILVVHSMDRLARNLDDLRRLVHKLTGCGMRIEFVKEGLTFTGEDSPMGYLRPSPRKGQDCALRVLYGVDMSTNLRNRNRKHSWFGGNHAHTMHCN